MFHLRRYFSIASLFAFLIVTALLGTLYRTVAVSSFIQLAEEQNVALTQSFANSLWPQLALLMSRGSMSEQDLVARLHPAVIAQMDGLSVVKVKVYNLQGITVFSTDLNQIGENDADNAGFQQAHAGQIVSELTYRDRFSSFEGVIENQNVLASYLPIRPAGPQSTPAGVLEVYSNVTPFLDRINRTQWQLVGGGGLILALLYGILLLIVNRADGIIRRQAAQQQAAAAALRQQQRELAVLHERERLARDLHDSLGQVLGYINAQTQAARIYLTQARVADADALLNRLIGVAQEAQGELRDFIRKLQDGSAHVQTLPVRIKRYLQQFESTCGITVHLVMSDAFVQRQFTPEVNEQSFRIVQEALNNVRQHAQARQVYVRCALQAGVLHITVQDDGCGFAPASSWRTGDGKLGLHSMKVRAQELRGALQIQAAPGKGTTIFLTAPIGVPPVRSIREARAKDWPPLAGKTGRVDMARVQRARYTVSKSRMSDQRYTATNGCE